MAIGVIMARPPMKDAPTLAVCGAVAVAFFTLAAAVAFVHRRVVRRTRIVTRRSDVDEEFMLSASGETTTPYRDFGDR